MRGGLADILEIKRQDPLPETAAKNCALWPGDDGGSGSEIRLGMRATEREIKRLSASGELAKYRMVHFATHGVLAGALDGAHSRASSDSTRSGHGRGRRLPVGLRDRRPEARCRLGHTVGLQHGGGR